MEPCEGQTRDEMSKKMYKVVFIRNEKVDVQQKRKRGGWKTRC